MSLLVVVGIAGARRSLGFLDRERFCSYLSHLE